MKIKLPCIYEHRFDEILVLIHNEDYEGASKKFVYNNNKSVIVISHNNTFVSILLFFNFIFLRDLITNPSLA